MAERTELTKTSENDSRINKFVVKLSQQVEGEFGTYTENPYSPGEVIMILKGAVVRERSKYTLQCGINDHMVPLTNEGIPLPGYYINHSCNPNSYIEVASDHERDLQILIIAREAMDPDEEITLDYACMEYETTIDGIECMCGAPNCRKIVSGYKNLPQEIKNAYLSEGIIPSHLSIQEGYE